MAGTLNFRRKKLDVSFLHPAFVELHCELHAGPSGGSQGTATPTLQARSGAAVRSASQRVPPGGDTYQPSHPAVGAHAEVAGAVHALDGHVPQGDGPDLHQSWRKGSKKLQPQHVGAVGAGARARLPCPQLPALSEDSGWGSWNAEVSKPRVPGVGGPPEQGEGREGRLTHGAVGPRTRFALPQRLALSREPRRANSDVPKPGDLGMGSPAGAEEGKGKEGRWAGEGRGGHSLCALWPRAQSTAPSAPMRRKQLEGPWGPAVYRCRRRMASPQP